MTGGGKQRIIPTRSKTKEMYFNELKGMYQLAPPLSTKRRFEDNALRSEDPFVTKMQKTTHTPYVECPEEMMEIGENEEME